MKKKLTYFFVIIFFLFLLIYGYLNIKIRVTPFFLFTNFLIIILSFLLLLKSKRNLCLKNIVYIFVLIFFGISPLYQINNNFYTWGTLLTNDEINKSNISILIILFVFYLFSRPIYFSKAVQLKIANKIFSNEIKKYTFFD